MTHQTKTIFHLHRLVRWLEDKRNTTLEGVMQLEKLDDADEAERCMAEVDGCLEYTAGFYEALEQVHRMIRAGAFDLVIKPVGFKQAPRVEGSAMGDILDRFPHLRQGEAGETQGEGV